MNASFRGGFAMTDEFVRAAYEGRVDDVKALLASGVDPNAKNEWGFSALSRAARKGHAGVVKV